MADVSWLHETLFGTKEFERLREKFEKEQPIKESGWCVPDSIFCALAFMIKRRVPVRMAIQRKKLGEDHVQAEALIDGAWVPLTEIYDGTSMAAITYKRHFPDAPEPYRYPTLGEFFDEQYELFRVEVK